jgi:hypothetical protein
MTHLSLGRLVGEALLTPCAVLVVPVAFGVWANAAADSGVTALSWPAAIEPAPQSRSYGLQSHFAKENTPWVK